MAKETLFRILSRQPWWVSLIVALVLFMIAQWIFPPVAPYVGIPFVLVAAWIAVMQWRGKATANVPERLAELRDMSWDEFSSAVADGYRRQGYTVTASREAGYDFAAVKGNRTTLVECRRWKVNAVGVGPVRELVDAMIRLEAYNGVCIAAVAFSPKAVDYARGKPVTLLTGNDLVDLVGAAGRAKRDSAR